MRRLLGKVAPVLALAIAVIACAMPARSTHATGAHASPAAAHLRSADAAHLEATTSSGPQSNGSAQSATDPATDDDQDSLGSEREAPGALPAVDGTGLGAPHASRIELRSTHMEAAVSRDVLPTVQPPRG
jgi:hypothetical protein